MIYNAGITIYRINNSYFKIFSIIFIHNEKPYPTKVVL